MIMLFALSLLIGLGGISSFASNKDLSSPAVGRSQTPPVVKAPSGTYIGIATETGRRFLGIRYAQSPVGPLRWAAPQAVHEGHTPYKAQEFGSVCVQPVNRQIINPRRGEPMKGSEDCLFLNVYGPARTADPRPVMVWIHGGAFVNGAGSDYDPHILAEKQNVIVVTINYRLGALGFLSHPALGAESGGYGLLDQQAALRWVRRNIASFGGDPARVTIFGESAGGVSVCALLRSPGAKGLFSRAIIESGPCVAFDRKLADQKGIAYAKAASCPENGPAAIACLRRLDAVSAGSTSGMTEVGVGGTPWTLVQGTAVLPGTGAMLDAGQFSRVPVLNGSNLDEGRLFALGGLGRLHNEADYLHDLKVQHGERGAKIAAFYPVSGYPSVALAFSAYLTDWLFACPALSANTAMSRYTPVYAYEFRDRNAPTGLQAPAELGTLGAFHSAEVQYVFQTPDQLGPARFTPEQQRVADRIQQAWATFARDGVPTISGEPAWVPVSAGNPAIRNLGTSGMTYVADFAPHHHCDFWARW
ncbi:carboxylesterase/lipase family protein [Trinickia symbiotica]|nr:carboxylesterase family protein [Trinickia symbiotica]